MNIKFKKILGEKMKPWELLGFPEPKSEASGGELSLKDYEVYSGIEIPNCPFIVRLDGWKFHRVCKELKLKKPFDIFLARSLIYIAKNMMKIWPAELCYIFSDEINLYYNKAVAWKRIEKIDSVFAGLASSLFQKYLISKGKKAQNIAFDCRCIPLFPKSKSKALLEKYLKWRMAECFRNHNNAWALYVLEKDGLSSHSAAKRIHGLKTDELKKLCAQHHVNLECTPAWQRKGIFLYWQKYQKIGYDPVKRKKVKVWRRKIVVDFDLKDLTKLLKDLPS